MMRDEEEEEEEDIGVTPNQNTLPHLKQVENTNYAVELGKRNGIHLVGTQGADIVDAYKTLILGLSWQLMKFVTGKPISDTDMLKFKDPAITTGLFFLDLLDAMRLCIMDPALVLNVSDNGAYEDRRQNDADIFFQAKLAISIARKMNALIFLILTFVGRLMSILLRALNSLFNGGDRCFWM
ncbi:calponin homology domain-containing protein [Suillus ampliporus]|nr:calponin homology domain-containing protein [Suillus ampliporus]